MDIAKFKARVPRVAETLGRMLVEEALPLYEQGGPLTFEEATPSVSLGYITEEGRHFKMTLSFDWATPEEVAEIECGNG